MIIGDKNNNNLTISTDIDRGISNLELSETTNHLSNKNINDLIDTLCEVRKENDDVVLMDNIKANVPYNNKSINPIELEKINEQREYDIIENDIIENLIDDPNMSVDEVNMMKANGFYDRYEKIKENKGDINMIDSIENEIRENIENDTTNNDEFNDTSTIALDSSELVTEENTFVNNEDDNKDEDYTPMTTEEFNDVPASTLDINEADITANIKKSYASISDEDTVELLNVMRRYQSGEKFSVYNALPASVKVQIDLAASEAGVTDRSIINFFAKNFINDLISDSYINKEIDNFQSEIAEITKSMNNIPGLIIDTYTDELKTKFEDDMIKMADDVEKEDLDKAMRLRRIADNFKASYTLSDIKETITKKPSLINRAYKSGRDSYDTYKRDFDEKFKDTKPKIKSFKSINNAIMYKLGYSEEYAKTFSVLVYNSIMAKNDNSVEFHIYAYYLMLGFININLSANNSEIMIELCRSIHDIMQTIESYMRDVISSKKKKKGSKKNVR